MFQGWRFQLREAEEAADQGQLDEACTLLTRGRLQRYLPGKRLTTKVASQLAKRARRRVIQGDVGAGWRDLQAAKSLAGDIGAVLSARQEIVELTLGEAENHIENDNPARAIQVLENLERLDVQDEPVRWLKEVARRLESARNLALRGRFADAEAQATAADKIHPKYGFAAQKAAEYHAKIEPFRKQTESLHRALSREEWSEAVSLAEQALEMAPENRLARAVRRRAWAQVGTPLADSHRAGRLAPQVGRPLRPVIGSGAGLAEEVVSVAEPQTASRFLLWVDGVGGYLVCLADEVILGQAFPDATIAVPLQADISRQHAKIARRGDGYVIEPLQATRINGQTIRGTTLLSDGDEIELAGTVRVRFRQPHALSASARLDLATRHPTQPKADGVLLMAESCVLGPKLQNHVVCRDWQGDVVLYRRDGELYCHAMDAIEIDGHLYDGRGQLTPNSHVSGSDFSLSLEALS
jgi:hypothetical protein